MKHPLKIVLPTTVMIEKARVLLFATSQVWVSAMKENYEMNSRDSDALTGLPSLAISRLNHTSLFRFSSYKTLKLGVGLRLFPSKDDWALLDHTFSTHI